MSEKTTIPLKDGKIFKDESDKSWNKLVKETEDILKKQNYEDLSFEPKMTWEDLCEFVNEVPGYNFDSTVRYVSIYINEVIVDLFPEGEIWVNNAVIAKNRTYEQMKAIIENLFDEVK